jgi:hypothetical protein
VRSGVELETGELDEDVGPPQPTSDALTAITRMRPTLMTTDGFRGWIKRGPACTERSLRVRQALRNVTENTVLDWSKTLCEMRGPPTNCGGCEGKEDFGNEADNCRSRDARTYRVPELRLTRGLL